MADSRAIGVPVVWVVDPWRRPAYYGGDDGRLTPEEGELIVPGTAVAVGLEEVFADLDRRQRRAGA